MIETAPDWARASAVIFDCNGTLVRSSDLVAEATIDAIEQCHLGIDPDNFRAQAWKHHGIDEHFLQSLAEGHATHLEDFDRARRQAFLKKNEYGDENILAPGLIEFLHRLNKNRVGIISNGDRTAIELLVLSTELVKYIKTADQIRVPRLTGHPPPKPSRDMLFGFLNSHNIYDFSNVIVITDGLKEIRSLQDSCIQTVGMTCFAQQPDQFAQELRRAGATWVYPDFHALTETIRPPTTSANRIRLPARVPSGPGMALHS